LDLKEAKKKKQYPNTQGRVFDTVTDRQFVAHILVQVFSFIILDTSRINKTSPSPYLHAPYGGWNRAEFCKPFCLLFCSP